MWVNRHLFDMIVNDNKEQQIELRRLQSTNACVLGELGELRTQQAKDNAHIDWLRNRVNALEKQNAILMQKVAGVPFPVPEIVQAHPGSFAGLPDYAMMPSFEDVGDEEAIRLGVGHDDAGNITYNDKKK